MTTKITALVDGSIYSASVCEHAAWAATRTSGSVELLHVLGRREAAEKQDLSGNITLGARSALLKELAELDEQRAKLVAHRGRAILEDAQAIVEKAGVSAVTTRLRQGDLVETVAHAEADAAMLMVGKRGEAADFAKGHLGSNLERIVRASHKPVFVAARAFTPVDSVLIAYDGGASAQKAVQHVAQDPLFEGLTLCLVRIGEDTPDARRSLEEAQALLADAGRAAETRLVAGQPETELGALVERESFGLVVMGAYGHSRIRSLIIGSTTTAMVRSCKAPVMLLR